MKILVAGATGAIGRLLVPQLHQAGHDVMAITRRSEHLPLIEQMGARAIIANALDREAMINVLAEVRPQVVYHQLTALADRDFSSNMRLRVHGTRNLVDASKAAGVEHLIAQSIAFAYEPGDHPATEDTPMDTHSEGTRKTTVDGIMSLERAVAEIPSHVVLRYGTLYGPGTWYDQEGFLAQQMRDQSFVATDGLTSFVHVQDAAQAALLALNWPSGPVNIVDDEPARGHHWIPVYAGLLRLPVPTIANAGAAWERGASNTRARTQYGWTPLFPSWRTGFTQSLSSEA